jgi:hypothetical protein
MRLATSLDHADRMKLINAFSDLNNPSLAPPFRDSRDALLRIHLSLCCSEIAEMYSSAFIFSYKVDALLEV